MSVSHAHFVNFIKFYLNCQYFYKNSILHYSKFIPFSKMDDRVPPWEIMQPENDDILFVTLVVIRILPDNNGEPPSVMAVDPIFDSDIISVVSKDGDMPQDYISEDEIKAPPTNVIRKKSHREIRSRSRFTRRKSECNKSSKYKSIYKSYSTSRIHSRSPRHVHD